jgi:hypothetical protein
MKKFVVVWILWILLPWIALANAVAAEKEMEVRGRELMVHSPPFTMALPAELRWAHSFSTDYPKESSRTRVHFFVREKNKQVQELLIIQIAERTNPRAEPISVPPLKPFSEDAAYLTGRLKRGDREFEYLVQLMGLNPKASSLQPLVKAGFSIPPHLALQGQGLFVYSLDQAVLVRFSKDAQSFGIEVSEKAERWKKGSIAGNEKKASEAFQKTFLDMIQSITFPKL